MNVQAPIRQLEQELKDFWRGPHIHVNGQDVCRQRIHEFNLSLVASEAESAVITRYVASDGILDHAELEFGIIPLFFEKQRERDIQIGRLALVEDLDECFVSLLVETNANLDLLVKLTEALKDFQPVEVRIILAEGPHVVVRIDLPLLRLRLINGFFLERIASLIGLEGVVGNSGLRLVLTLVVESQLQNGVGHGALVDVFEVLQHHCQQLVVEVAVVPQVEQNLPWLHEL